MLVALKVAFTVVTWPPILSVGERTSGWRGDIGVGIGAPATP
jgi:hypothetical protein